MRVVRHVDGQGTKVDPSDQPRLDRFLNNSVVKKKREYTYQNLDYWMRWHIFVFLGAFGEC